MVNQLKVFAIAHTANAKHLRDEPKANTFTLSVTSYCSEAEGRAIANTFVNDRSPVNRGKDFPQIPEKNPINKEPNGSLIGKRAARPS